MHDLQGTALLVYFDHHLREETCRNPAPVVNRVLLTDRCSGKRRGLEDCNPLRVDVRRHRLEAGLQFVRKRKLLHCKKSSLVLQRNRNDETLLQLANDKGSPDFQGKRAN